MFRRAYVGTEQYNTMFYTKPPAEFLERTHKLREALKAAA
jgi:hypothetical protein